MRVNAVLLEPPDCRYVKRLRSCKIRFIKARGGGKQGSVDNLSADRIPRTEVTRVKIEEPCEKEKFVFLFLASLLCLCSVCDSVIFPPQM